MLADFQGDRGKSVPMTTIAAIYPGLRWLTPLILWIFQWFPLTDLMNLRFIHFARWVIFKRDDFRVLDSNQPREKLRYDYLVFSTNFNNQWEQYIDAFSLVLRFGVNSLWITCRRFPLAWPIRLFKIYIRYNEYPTNYYYNAYPEASVRDIEAALNIDKLLDQFMTKTRDMDPDTFKLEYEVFVRRIQNMLAAGRPDPTDPAWTGRTGRTDWPLYRDTQPINLETL
jgi:hypothetical protein